MKTANYFRSARMPRTKRPFIVFTFLFFFFCLWKLNAGREVSMKVVDEPSSFGYPNQEEDVSHELKMRIQPSNFSGPPHLRHLYGKCFTKIDDSYKYDFCPFSNLTQHEQSLRWNPYSGVLGVWQEWEIVNNTFTAMIMGEGDACGSKQRQTKVVLECGDNNVVDKVTEPQTCQYLVVFKTPLVCHPHAMLVYPTLNSTLRHEWDLLEGQYQNQELTLKGYNKAVHRLLEQAGYVLPESEKKAIAKEAVEKEKRENKKNSGNFDTLDQCSEEYKKLKEEIAGLRSLLSVYQGTNGTDVKKPNRDPVYDDYSDHHDHDMERYRYHDDY